MWTINESPIDADRLGTLVPERVLFEFDGPRTYTAHDPDGELLLLHQCGESDRCWRYFVVPFRENLVEQLEAGQIDLRTALNQPRLWIADVSAAGVDSLYSIRDLEAIEPYLPLAGTMLWPELEPLLSVRSMGAGVELGLASIGMLKSALSNAQGALKTLAAYATGEAAKRGQPSARTKRYYDLPAVILAGSVRVSLLPRHEAQQRLFAEDEVWTNIEETLSKAIRFSTENADENVELDEQLRVGLQALSLLAPPAYGVVEETEISGRLVFHQRAGHPLQIDRNFGATVRRRLKEETVHQSEWVTSKGFISELDLEESTCKLRDESGNTLQNLWFETERLTEIKDAFDMQVHVEIVAESFPGSTVAELLKLNFVPE